MTSGSLTPSHRTPHHWCLATQGALASPRAGCLARDLPRAWLESRHGPIFCLKCGKPLWEHILTSVLKLFSVKKTSIPFDCKILRGVARSPPPRTEWRRSPPRWPRWRRWGRGPGPRPRLRAPPTSPPCSSVRSALTMSSLPSCRWAKRGVTDAWDIRPDIGNRRNKCLHYDM